MSEEAKEIVGQRLLPIEPTEAMLDAYWHQTGESHEMRARTHARMRRYWEVMAAAAPDVIPDGWKLVPVEPTPEMNAAGNLMDSRLKYVNATDIWSAMIATTPARNTSQIGEG